MQLRGRLVVARTPLRVALCLLLVAGAIGIDAPWGWGQRAGVNPRLAAIPANTALDLGRYECNQPTDNPDDCGLITDYSKFVYDAAGHQFLMFGGGHAVTHRTDVDAFDLQSLKWKSAYPSTPCAQMRLGNIDPVKAAWRSTGHPIARHTYDMVVMADKPPRLLLLNGAGGGGRCVELPSRPGPDPYSIEGRIAAYDPTTRTWTYSAASAGGWQPHAAAEWDPVSRRVIVLDQYALWTYDPDSQKKMKYERLTAALGYAKNLVYFPPTDRMYYFADGDAVFEVALARSDFSRSTLTRVTGISGDIPELVETGFAYDPLHQAIGGAIRNGVFYGYFPLTKKWVSRRIKLAPPGSRVTNVAFHALDYDPVNHLFFFITDPLAGQRTWAFRFSPEEGVDANPSRVATGRARPPCPAETVLRVGAKRSLEAPSWAADCAKDGDIIEVDAGLYSGDVAVWTKNDLTIRGVGGRPQIHVGGRSAEGKAIWVVKGRNTTIENFEFSGAQVPDGNGAAIRLEGPGLIVRHAYFHDNEMGILTGVHPQSDVLIEGSEFANNASQNPRTHNHNIYIGAVRRFTLRSSYVHHARVGHNVKTRARENHILYNRIMDEADGSSSYLIELANGGNGYLIGNVLHQGPRTENSTMVSYGAETLIHPMNELYVVNNTMVNDLPAHGIFVQVHGAPSVVKLINNLLVGKGRPLVGPGTLLNNLTSSDPGFRNRSAFDYQLLPWSPAIDAGVVPPAANGVALTPVQQYVHMGRSEPRPDVGALDVGAYEFSGAAPTREGRR